MANLVTPMPMIRARFFDDNARPLSGGKIYTYEPNSTTPKTTYKDLAATTPNTNPILLDVAGEADIYFDGQYRVIVESWRGEQLYDVDNIGALAQIKASFVVDASGQTQQQINEKLKKIGYANFRDIREFGATQDKTTDYTALILSTISSLGEGAQLYIPYGVKWAATSNPTAVYAAMPDNATIIDDSGYEDRYGTKYWQASTQIYYDTKDYGGAGRANGNGLNIRANYNGYLNFEMDGAFGTNNCKATILWRMNNGTADAIQIAGDGVDSAKAHLAFATYGAYSLGSSALKMGLQSSISPHSFAFNSDLIQDTSYIFGKRLPRTLQGTPEDTPTWQAASHSTRWSQPTSHTGSFFQFWFIGSSQKFRQEIAQDGKFELINANSVRFTMKADGGINNRKSVITPTTSTTLLSTDSASYVSNVSATGGYTVTLPKAILGLSFEFSVDAAQALRVAPNAVDNFVGLLAGKYKESSTIGSKLKVTAITANIWSFEQVGTWADQV